MRRTRRMTRVAARVMAAVMLAGAVMCAGLMGTPLRNGSACAEQTYVSIREIRESLPERWTGDYTVKKGDGKHIKNGDTISIDAPIIVPAVDAVPVVRITWEPPVEGLDESFVIKRNQWDSKIIGRNFPLEESNFPAMEENVTFDPELPWEDAPTIAVEELKKYFPFMKDKEFTCYFHYSYGESEDNGFQWLYFYTTYHGIPHLLGGDYFWHGVRSEYLAASGEKKGVPGVPQSKVGMLIKRPGQFWTNIDTAKEMGIDVEDIPLLPFNEILEVLQQRVAEGYAYSLNEVRFGYMGFIDPEKNGEEFVLLPVWAAKGRTRSDLTTPFDLKNAQVVMDRSAYGCSSIVVNAQTGQVYDLYNDKRPDRRYVPHIITWEEVGM